MAACIGIDDSSSQLNDDVLGLIVIKSGIKDPSSYLDPWNQDDNSPCSWIFIQCDPFNGRVSEISLDGLNLSGEIGKGLQNLQYLKVLSLSHNHFNVSIEELGSIYHLESLILATTVSQGVLFHWRPLMILRASFTRQQQYSRDQSPWLHWSRKRTPIQGRSEFLGRSPRMDSNRKLWNSSNSAPAQTNSLVNGNYANLGEGAIDHQDYYSTFHKIRNRKRFTEQECEDFSRESTRQAMEKFTASPDFT